MLLTDRLPTSVSPVEVTIESWGSGTALYHFLFLILDIPGFVFAHIGVDRIYVLSYIFFCLIVGKERTIVPLIHFPSHVLMKSK
jgi:hypothetical protein